MTHERTLSRHTRRDNRCYGTVTARSEYTPLHDRVDKDELVVGDGRACHQTKNCTLEAQTLSCGTSVPAGDRDLARIDLADRLKRPRNHTVHAPPGHDAA